MKHLIILYASYNNGTADKKAMYEASTADEAIASFHNYMGTYMKDKTVDHVLVMAINSEGGILKNESYTRASDSTDDAE